MNKSLIKILNDLVSIDPDRCHNIIYQWAELFEHTEFENCEYDIMSGNYESIPLFWRMNDPWGYCRLDEIERKAWTYLCGLSYDKVNGGVYAFHFRLLHSLPPDEGEINIEEVDDTVIVAVIHLLLNEIYPLSQTADIKVLFNCCETTKEK